MYLHLIREAKSKGKGGRSGCKPFCTADSDYRYAYDFDDIGNRESSSERGTNSVYAANQLNQYTAVDDFTPEFDDDGNQTIIKTATGIWQVQYNGENRPVRWMRPCDGLIVEMSYDCLGRRVQFGASTFIYAGYLNVGKAVWDPTETTATRPIVRVQDDTAAYYFHDGNKNVVDVLGDVLRHYDFTPFGKVLADVSDDCNPWQFSSEHFDQTMGATYYNYRHYVPIFGRWTVRDQLEESEGANLYGFKDAVAFTDLLGLKKCRSNNQKPGYEPSVNGCGTEGGFPVPDSYFGMVDFTACCNGHDRCYGTCGNNRSDCDSDLSDCMKKACDEYFTLPIAWHERVACRATASIYWGVLRALGGPAYESAQDEACEEEECCDDNN